VDLPEPEGPEMTMGRLACSGRSDSCQPMASTLQVLWWRRRTGGHSSGRNGSRQGLSGFGEEGPMEHEKYKLSI
jgi:hypothetical protein